MGCKRREGKEKRLLSTYLEYIRVLRSRKYPAKTTDRRPSATVQPTIKSYNNQEKRWSIAIPSPAAASERNIL
jgi:hypothetical protein